MAYWDTGIGEAVLLLHGFPFDKSMWEPQIGVLTNNGFRAVVPDFPGFGETSWSGETITMDEMACCCAALLDKLKIERAVICGLSMGSYVTFELAHLFPNRVSALVLAGARAGGPDEAERTSRDQQAKRALAEGMNFAIDSILNNMLAPGTLANKPAVVSHVRKMIEATNAAVGRQSFLRARVERCRRERGVKGALVAVDFYERGSVVEVARRLNAQR